MGDGESDARTRELTRAHDVLADFYAERLPGMLEAMPTDRAVLDLFAEYVVGQAGRSSVRPPVGDIGCGTGRLAPYLAARGLAPEGVDLSPRMIEVARRDFPDFPFAVADLRALPFPDGSLAGVVCWYSLMYLPAAERPAAFAELARVVRPGGYLATAFKAGDGEHRRGGGTTGLGVEFDLWFLAPEQVRQLAGQAGFDAVFWAGRPADETESGDQGYLVARRR